MKKIFLIFTILIAGLTALGQNSFSQQFVGSGGNVTHNSSYLVHWSVGDLVTATAPLGAGSLTQGFEQPQVLHPEVQALLVNFTNPFADHFTANWTNGGGTARVVFVKQAASGTTTPVNNATYNPDASFGGGTQIGTTGWFCVFNGTGSSVTITNVVSGLPYTVQVFEYNGGAGSEQYTGFSYIDNPMTWSFSCTNPATGGVIAGNQTICVNTAPASFTSVSLPPAPYEGTLEYQWRISTDGSVFLDISGETGTDYTFTGLINVPTWFRRMTKVTCQSTWVPSANDVKIELEQAAVAGTLAKTPNQATACQGIPVSASLTTGSGGNGTDELQYRTETGAVWSSWSSYISGTTIATTGLSGVEIQTQRLGTYCSSSTYTTVSWTVSACTITWTGALTSDWNTPGNWNENIVPFAVHSAVIPNGTIPHNPMVNEAVATPAECLDLTIESDRVLTIASNKALTVNGTLANLAGNGGLIIESGGSLLHNSGGVAAMVRREISGSASLDQYKYHFVSIPTQYASPTSNLFFGSYLYKLDPLQLYTADHYGKWIALGTPTNTTLSTGQGYMVYYPEATHTYTFEGNLNNGTFSYALTGHSGTGIYTFNLVPNPYPSSIVWNTGAAGWSHSAGIGGVCYLWNANTGNYSSISSGSTSYIPVGQAMMVMVYDEASPTLSVNNIARAHSDQEFYKSNSLRENRLTVKATANDLADETLVAFTDGSTQGFDLQTDGIKLNGQAEAPQLYTLSGEENYSINNLPPLTGQQIVPMNFEGKFSGSVTLQFSDIESFNPLLKLYLKDLLTSENINLRDQPTYTFTHNAANQANRFQLLFGGLTGIENPNGQSGRMWIVGNKLIISAPHLANKSGNLVVYDASGRQLQYNDLVLSERTTVQIDHHGFVIVKLVTDQQTMTVKGIITN